MSFYPWIDDSDLVLFGDTANCLSNSSFDIDSQRKKGFVGGTPSSALRVNTALRQSNLVAAALMKALDLDNEHSVESSLDAVTNSIKSKIPAKLFITNADNRLCNFQLLSLDNSVLNTIGIGLVSVSLRLPAENGNGDITFQLLSSTITKSTIFSYLSSQTLLEIPCTGVLRLINTDYLITSLWNVIYADNNVEFHFRGYQVNLSDANLFSADSDIVFQLSLSNIIITQI